MLQEPSPAGEKLLPEGSSPEFLPASHGESLMKSSRQPAFEHVLSIEKDQC